MKKIITMMLAVSLVLMLAAAAYADSPFHVEDGNLVGTYEADGFIEIYVNGKGAGAGMNSVDIKAPSIGEGEDVVQIFVNGYIQTAYKDGEEVDEESLSELEEVDEALIAEVPAEVLAEAEARIAEEEAAAEAAVAEAAADEFAAQAADNSAQEDANAPLKSENPEVDSESVDNSNETTVTSAPSQSGNGTVLWIVIAIVVIAAAAVVILLRSKKHAE